MALGKKTAGSGALGDIAAHIVDAAYFLTGSKITKVSGQLRTFIEERPIPAAYTGLTAAGTSARGKVTVDDTAVFTAQLDNGAIGVLRPLALQLAAKMPCQSRLMALRAHSSSTLKI